MVVRLSRGSWKKSTLKNVVLPSMHRRKLSFVFVTRVKVMGVRVSN